ncbi:hypothetical protein EV426DRAFT_606376 [Tirmania nivea]|nr:hypothetical protein EV426DRAFT_606376 [Tirmania nivea]
MDLDTASETGSTPPNPRGTKNKDEKIQGEAGRYQRSPCPLEAPTPLPLLPKAQIIDPRISLPSSSVSPLAGTDKPMEGNSCVCNIPDIGPGVSIYAHEVAPATTPRPTASKPQNVAKGAKEKQTRKAKTKVSDSFTPPLVSITSSTHWPRRFGTRNTRHPRYSSLLGTIQTPSVLR